MRYGLSKSFYDSNSRSFSKSQVEPSTANQADGPSGDANPTPRSRKAPVEIDMARKKRKRTGVSNGKKQKIEMAKKRAARKCKVKALGHSLEAEFVFVGNVPATADESDLRSFFAKCGNVTNVQIRCSGGVVTAKEIPHPSYYEGFRVRQYATVCFSTVQEARKALSMNGSMIGNAEIVVCGDAIHLPEVKEMIANTLHRHGNRTPGSRAHRLFGRKIAAQPTLLVLDNGDEAP